MSDAELMVEMKKDMNKRFKEKKEAKKVNPLKASKKKAKGK